MAYIVLHRTFVAQVTGGLRRWWAGVVQANTALATRADDHATVMANAQAGAVRPPGYDENRPCPQR